MQRMGREKRVLSVSRHHEGGKTNMHGMTRPTAMDMLMTMANTFPRG